MLRIIAIVAACLVVGDATRLLPEADDVECCDGDGKQCPPMCPTCTCAWHSLKTAPATVVEIKPIRLTTFLVELPPPAAGHGRLAPPPTTRPPIA